MRIELATAEPRRPADERIGLTDGDVVGLLSLYQQLGYFRLDLESGLTYFSHDACQIVGLEKTGGPASLSDIVRRLHADDLAMVTSTFETAGRLKTGFDLICRLPCQGDSERFIRMAGTFRENAGEGEIAGIVHMFFEQMRIVDFSEAE